MFSKTTCPYCDQAKATMTRGGVQFKLVELDQVNSGSDMQNELKNLTGQRTVPNTYIGGVHIGGNDDLNAKIRSGIV